MIKPQAMKVKCIKCLATTMITPKSDAVIVPCCKKCGGEMEVVGIVGAMSLIENVIKGLFPQK